MRNVFVILFLLVVFSCGREAKKLVLEKGISLELSRYRKQQITEVIYDLDFNIPKVKTDVIFSKLVLKFRVNDISKDVFLDFNAPTLNLKSLKINNIEAVINHQQEHLVISKKGLKLGKNSLVIFFNAGEKSLNRNEAFLYTLLVPDRASTLFPCFDQPDIKAKYNLTITAPKEWTVLAGAFKESSTVIDGFTRHRFAQSDSMSTYLFSFVAGIFTVDTQNPGAFDMRFLHRENDREKIDESVSEVFKIHQNSIEFLETYTQVKFPFQKMDFVAIPSFQYGGMEHVGAIQYRQSSLLLDKNATQNSKLSRAKLIAHETSHMWFGNLVTMKWFNDVWMKEVFANFMADKIMNPIFPEINHRLNFMMTHYPRAYSEDRTKGTNAIRQYLGNLKDAGSLYGRIIYNKSPIMMRQLETLMGEAIFKEGIQEYIKTFANSNADWDQLVSILDKKSPVLLKKWSAIWVNSPGRPIFYEEMLLDEAGGLTKLRIHQKAEDGSSRLWTQSFAIRLLAKNGDYKDITIENIEKSIDLSEVSKGFKLAHILYNTNGFGYGVFPIKIKEINGYQDIVAEVSRGYQFINLFENMLLGNVRPLQLYQVYLAAIQKEENELIADYISTGLQTIFWTFLTEDQKNAIQIETENKIENRLASLLPKNLKKTLFNLYQSIAISAGGTEKLYQIWKRDKKIKNLFLNENDLSSLATTLAIYEHPKAAEILQLQLKSISNKDRSARFEWLLPSLSSDENIRDNFMKSLLQQEGRENESWVETALVAMNHPLRQHVAKKHLKSILEALEAVQLTGDIFFPKGWLASSIGRYSSAEAHAILSQFLAENKNYNPILLKKLMQTTDMLSRAQKIRK
jgi:aminopeptidase N